MNDPRPLGIWSDVSHGGRRFFRRRAVALSIIAGLALLGGSSEMNAGTRAESIASRKCAECHSRRAVFSHPVDVVPSMRTPAELPLDHGKLTCVTCHEAADDARHALAKDRHDGMLRASAGTATLCAQCHEKQAGRFKSQHIHSLGRAHLDVPGRQVAGLSAARVFDQESRNCMSCHDGAGAVDIGDGLEGTLTSRGHDHPVGAAYNDRRTFGKRVAVMPLRPMTMLHSDVRLFEGRVGCGSCHSPYSAEPKLLVMSNVESRLCLSCHNGK